MHKTDIRRNKVNVSSPQNPSLIANITQLDRGFHARRNAEARRAGKMIRDLGARGATLRAFLRARGRGAWTKRARRWVAVDVRQEGAGRCGGVAAAREVDGGEGDKGADAEALAGVSVEEGHAGGGVGGAFGLAVLEAGARQGGGESGLLGQSSQPKKMQI